MIARRRRTSAVAGFVSAVLAIAACGGSDDGAGDGAVTDQPSVTLAPTGPAPTDNTGDVAPPPTDSTADGTDPDGTDGAGSDPSGPDTTQPGTSDGPSATTTIPADPPGPEIVAPEILQVAGTTIDGRELDLATLADRPVLLWFWAPF